MQRILKTFGLIALTAIIGLTITACPPGGGGGGDGGEDPTGITLDKSSLNLISGQTGKLNVSVEPLNANRTVTWSSSNNSIATVSWNGTVTAVSTGNAVITATTKGGLTANCSVNVWHTPTSIEVTQNPDKTWYVVGDDPVLDTYGLVVTSTYDGGTEIIPSDAVTVSGFNASSAGGREITVTWGGQSDTFTVTVVSITAINVGVPTPIKTALGEDLDILILEKITVTATYSNSATENVTSRITLANISGFNKNTSGVQTLTVSYRPQVNSNTGTFTVTVLEVSSIAVNTQPNKTKYAIGEALDITGLTIEVTFSDSSKTTATPALADISIFDSSSIGVKTLTITYSGKTATFTVTVIEVESIAVKTPPSKTRYAIGEALDITGLEIEATYNDNSKETLGTGTINLSYITGFSSAAATASQTVTVTYAGKPATFNVKVYAVVTFNPNGGNWSGSTVNQTKETEGNATVETPADPARENYAFDGWYTQQAGGTKLDSATRITANTTLYAQWEPAYDVTFDANGGAWGSDAVKIVSVAQNTVVTPPENPSHTLYPFDNWYTQAEGGTKADFATPITEDTAFFAHWNTTLTGTVTISGAAAVSQTLTAVTTAITPNGGGDFSYQWKRVGTGGTTTNIGTTSTYTVQIADVGSTITVTVTRAGYTGSVTSSATGTVPTPTLTGTIEYTGRNAGAGYTSFIVNNRVDANIRNSNYSGSLSYQWQSNYIGGSGNWSNIGGATIWYYTPTSTGTYRVVVTCTGFNGSITGGAITIVSN